MIHSTSAHRWRRAHNLLAAVATIFGAQGLPAQGSPAPVVFHVSLGQASATPVSGRLLIFAKLLAPGDKRPVARVDMDQIDTHATAIAAHVSRHLKFPTFRHLKFPTASHGGRYGRAG